MVGNDLTLMICCCAAGRHRSPMSWLVESPNQAPLMVTLLRHSYKSLVSAEFMLYALSHRHILLWKNGHAPRFSW